MAIRHGSSAEKIANRRSHIKILFSRITKITCMHAELYKQILLDNDMKRYAAKYQFRGLGNLGKQDFFVLLDLEHHEKFYVVPCQWNRQLAHKADNFEVYHHCPRPHHAYHGNGKNIMATLEDPNLFSPAEIQRNGNS